MNILDIEHVEWRAVSDGLPDDDTTVLVHAPGASEPAWLGFYDGVYWFSVDGPEYGNEEEIAQPVTAWAPMPRGPTTHTEAAAGPDIHDCVIDVPRE